MSTIQELNMYVDAELTEEGWVGRAWSTERDSATRENRKHGYTFPLPLARSCSSDWATASVVYEVAQVLIGVSAHPEKVLYAFVLPNARVYKLVDDSEAIKTVMSKLFWSIEIGMTEPTGGLTPPDNCQGEQYEYT